MTDAHWAKVGDKIEVVGVEPLPFGHAVPFSEGDLVTVAFIDADWCIGLAEYPPMIGPVRSYSHTRFRLPTPSKPQPVRQEA
jgi:hypothetical protein